MEPWITEEQQNVGSNNVTNSGAVSIPIVLARSGNERRTSIIITNSTVGASMRIIKGDSAATATLGIPLSTGQNYMESDDGGYTCYQGQFNVYSDIAGTISVTEMLSPRYS